jgi:hypothetical protein
MATIKELLLALQTTPIDVGSTPQIFEPQNEDPQPHSIVATEPPAFNVN